MSLDLTIKENSSDMKKYLALRKYPYGTNSINYYRKQEGYENITEDEYNSLIQGLKQYIEELGDLS